MTVTERVRLARLWAVGHQRKLVLAAAAAGLVLGGAATVDLALLVAAATTAVGAALGLQRSALLLAATLLGGFAVGALRAEALEAPARGLRPGAEIVGKAHLLSAPRPGQFGDSVQVALHGASHDGLRLLARLPREQRSTDRLGVGVVVALRGRLVSVSGSEPAPAPWLRGAGLLGELRVEALRVSAPTRAGPVGMLDRIRNRARLGASSGLDRDAAALVDGMVLGQDERIAPETLDDFQRSGLSHVLAVSGQNVMLLAALALPLLGLLGLPRGARLALTVALIALYVPLAGAGPSLQRAGVMGVAGLVALALSRPASRWYALLLAAVATLVLDPRAWQGVGWQLSFAAVVGILALAPALGRGLSVLPRPLAEGVSLTVTATLATAPLLAHHFEVVSAVSLPANVAALPLVAPIMWLGMLRAALAQAGAIAGPLVELLGVPLGWLLDGLAWIARHAAALPGAQLRFELTSWWSVGFAYLLLAALVAGVFKLAASTDRQPFAAAWRRRPDRHKAVVVALAAATVALCAWRWAAPPQPPKTLTVSYLDVGQGDATLIQHPDGTAVLFDGGPPEARVTRLLREAGVRRLSLVVMTHQSRDHQGGLLDVVRSYPVDLLLDGGDGTRDPDFKRILAEARGRGIRTVRALAPMDLSVGALRVRVYSPPPREPGPPPEDPNPRAIVAVVSSGDFDLMLSGDAESETLSALDLPAVEAIKVPHHGSADPGLSGVLRRLRPRVAGIEVGADNGYGHPTASTLRALARAGVRTYRTDRDGTVRLHVSAGSLEAETER